MLAAWVGLSTLASGKVSEAEAEILFVDKIKPLLESKCGDCHGDAGKKIKGDYDMRSTGSSGSSLSSGKVP